MKDWRRYDPRKVEDDKELIFDHSITHSWWNNPGLRPEGIAEEDIKRLHDAIVEEMLKRGIQHHTPIELEKPYAAVHRIRDKPLGKEITLEEVLVWFKKPIVLSKGFVTLVGGLPEHGSTNGDIDLLIKWPEDTPEEVVHPVKFRLGRSLPPELASRIQFLLDKYHGPFTSHVPVYDLVLVPTNSSLVQMSTETQSVALTASDEAEQSEKEDEVVPGRFFYPLKATTGYHEGEVYSLEQVMSWFKWPDDYPLYVQKKYDGLRIIWHKIGDEVRAWSDDGTRCEDRFPTLVKMLKELPVESIVLDSEVEGWSGNEHWGREVTAGYARAHEQEPDDRHFVANVFDVLYVEGLPKHHELPEGDLHRMPYEVRYRVLQYIGSLVGWQSTVDVPEVPGFNVVPSFVVEKNDAQEFEKAIKAAWDVPGSEGVMIKSAKGDYPLTGRTNTWLKYKKSADVHAVVIEKLPTKTEGVYRYRVGLLLTPGWEAPEEEIKEVQLKDGQMVKVLDVGNTFNTKRELEPGEIVTVLFHTLFVYEDGRVKLYEPKLYEVRPDQVIPDTVEDAIRIARQAGLLQEKKLAIEVPFVMQFHFRGGSVHADLRIQKPGEKVLEGWTLAIQEEDLFEQAVMEHWKVEKDGQLRKVYWDDELYYVYDMKKDEVLQWNSELDEKILRWHKEAVFEHPEWWKIDLKTGRPKEREPGVETKAPIVEKIWASPKSDEPFEWLKVEGIYPPREVEPVPGGTRFWPGIFVLVDEGTVEYGAQKSYFKEFFFHGKILKGRYVLRLVNRNGQLQWLFWKTDDDVPYVVSKRAVRIGWMPPAGQSALPKEWEKKVPEELRWWETQDQKEAKRRRNEFVKRYMEEERYLLQYQWWRGPVVIRRGPSREEYYLRVIRKDGVVQFRMEGDPRREKVPGVVEEVEYDEFWDVGEGAVVEIPPGTEYNKTKDTPSWLMTLESGKCTVLEKSLLVWKIDLGENRTFLAVRHGPDENIWECWVDSGGGFK